MQEEENHLYIIIPFLVNVILISPMLYHRGHLAKIQTQFDSAVKPKLLPLLAQAQSVAEKVSALLDQRRNTSF